MEVELFRRPPCRRLAPFVELIWGVRAASQLGREVILPNGATELMIGFGATQRVHAYGDQAVDQKFRDAWLAGIQAEPLTIGSPDGCDHIAVRFRPGGAHAFFGMPSCETAGQVVPLDAVVGPAAAALRDRLGSLPSDAARADAVEAWLLERLRSVHPYYATLRKALDMVRASAFATSVGELCDRLGLSNRHLIAQFRQVAGLTPKTLARIERFHAVIDATKGRVDVDWAGLTYRFHFADQSHLVREFQRFARTSPTRFLAQRTAEGATMCTADRGEA